MFQTNLGTFGGTFEPYWHYATSEHIHLGNPDKITLIGIACAIPNWNRLSRTVGKRINYSLAKSVIKSSH